MAEVDVNFNVNTPGAEKAAANIRDVDLEIKKTSKSTSELTDEFGVQNTMLGKIWKSFKDGIKVIKLTTGSLKGMLVASGIGALLIAVTGLYNWFKKTETGADLLSKGMKVLGEVIMKGPLIALNSLKAAFFWVTGQKDKLEEVNKALKKNINDIKDSAALADKIDALDDKRRDNLVKLEQLETKISQGRADAINQELTYAERKKGTTDALAAMSEQYKINLELAQDAVDIAKEELRLNPDLEGGRQKLAEATAALQKVETTYIDEKRNVSRLSVRINKEMVTDAQKAADELQKIKNENTLLEKSGLDKQLTELDIWYNEQKKLHSNNKDYLYEIDKQYNLKRKKLEEDYYSFIKDIHKETANMSKEALASTQQISSDITKTLEDQFTEEVERQDVYWNETYPEMDGTALESEIEMRKEHMQEIKDVTVAALESASNAIFEINARNKQREYDNTMSKLDAEREREINNARGNKTKIAAINKKFDKQEEEIKKKKFKEDKRRQILEANMAISLAVIQAMPVWSQVIAVGIAGAAQLAVIASQKYTRGGRVPEKKALGGPIVGYSHGMGGVQIEAEGGEYMINKEVMKNPVARSLVEEINSNGAPSIQELVQQEIQRTPIYTNITEVNKEAKKIQLREYGFTRKR